MIELRSDTFTQPTDAMKAAMMAAPLGDDMVGEDPTVNRLESTMADLLGKEAAVFACSGTQSNQMAVWALCERGDELLIEETGHLANYECGTPAILSSVSVRRLPGDHGRLDLPHLEGQLRPIDDHFPPTTLLCLENSTNLGGGRTYSLQQLQRVSDWAHRHKLRVHLDGARLFNACAANGYSAAQVAQCVDTVSICFSKGLGCPMGSILVGPQDVIRKARRARKILGGSLRQSGIVAAAALHAIEHHLDQLAVDHAHAKRLAAGLAQIPHVRIDLDAVETNLVYFEISPEWGSAYDLERKAAEGGVLLYSAGGTHRLRACTHRDVNEEQIDAAIRVFQDCLSSPI